MASWKGDQPDAGPLPTQGPTQAQSEHTTHIHAISEIRTHVPKVRAGECILARSNKYYIVRSRDSSVGIVTGYRARFSAVSRDFSIYHSSPISSGVHPVSYAMGNEGSFPGSKAAWLKHDGAIHLLPYTSLWQYLII
jgi:hypothetical protein